MALVIGIVIILIVLFMIFAMAMAEWMDKDPGEFFRGWFKTKKSAKDSGTEVIPDAAEKVLAPPPPAVKPRRPRTKSAAAPATKKATKKAVRKSAPSAKTSAKTKSKKRTTT